MATLDQLNLSKVIKLILLGDSGSGKSGALACLANDGYKLRMLDFDNGANILKSYVKPESVKNVEVETCTDKYRTSGGRIFPATATAWMKAVKLLDNWPPYGPVSTWGTGEILVIDSSTFAGKTAMNFHMNLNARLAVPATWQDYKPIQGYIDNLLSLLFSDSIQCHVIVVSHIDYQAPPGTTRDEREKQEIFRGYPTSVGSAMGPKIGRYFNSMLLVRDGQIWTVSRDGISLKTEAPHLLRQCYPIGIGLSEIFSAIRGGEKPVMQTAPQALPAA